jgi:hypothetical protein
LSRIATEAQIGVADKPSLPAIAATAEQRILFVGATPARCWVTGQHANPDETRRNL